MKIVDIGCEDFEAAFRNRKMISNKENITGYLLIEAIVKSWPHGEFLPTWMYGRLPIVGKEEARELYKYGIYGVDNKKGYDKKYDIADKRKDEGDIDE